MSFNLNEYGVGGNSQAVRYLHHGIRGERQAEGVPDLIERYTTANWAYESNESDSDKDEELIKEGGLEDEMTTHEPHAPDPAPSHVAP